MSIPNPFKRHDSIKVLVAISIIAAFNFMIYALAFIEIPEANRELFIHLLGMVDGAFVNSLVGYYYTKGEDDKPKQQDEIH